MDEMTINTISKYYQVYLNRNDLIKFIEAVRDTTLSNESRIVLKQLIETFKSAT